MQQINRAIYLVDDGEVVTLEIQATKVGNFASLVIDGKSIDPTGKTPLTFHFTVSLPPSQTHHGMITCFFPTSAPPDAKFEVFVSGSSGGGKFTGSDIKQINAIWIRAIEFRRP